MLWIGLASCFLDILSEETIRNIDKYPIWLIYLVMYTYYILQNSIPFISSLYGLELLDKLKGLKLREKIILYTPVVLVLIILLSNNLTSLVFYIDETGNYIRGVGFLYLFIQAGYYLILNILISFYNKKLIRRKIRFMVMGMSVAIITIIIIDFILDNVMIQSFFISVCMLLLFIVIQNSEEELVDSTGLLTRHALIIQLQMDFINKDPFTIILLKLEDKAIINFTIGTNYWFSLINEVSIYLQSLDRQQGVYNIEDGLFVIKIKSNLPFVEKDQLLRSIMSKFVFSKWSVLNVDLSISARILEISYPEDIEEIIDLFNYIEYFKDNTFNSKNIFLKVKDLSFDIKNQQTAGKKELMKILDGFQYELCFMPIYSVSDNKMLAREPLLKLSTNPPTYVSPCELDNETEDYRNLKKIHIKIFEDICSYVKKNLTTNGEKPEHISINLSVAHLMQEDLLQQLSSIIRVYQLDYSIFGIEISEVMDFYDQPIIYQNIKKLREYGLPFILDGFGTGRSSFEYFKHISFKYVKLDKSFIKKCFDMEKGIIVLKSTIDMIKSLQIAIIADGVETKEMADSLISLGIDYLQGTYFLLDESR